MYNNIYNYSLPQLYTRQKKATNKWKLYIIFFRTCFGCLTNGLSNDLNCNLLRSKMLSTSIYIRKKGWTGLQSLKGYRAFWKNNYSLLQREVVWPFIGLPHLRHFLCFFASLTGAVVVDCKTLWSSTEKKSKNQSLLHVKYLQYVPYTIKFKTLWYLLLGHCWTSNPGKLTLYYMDVLGLAVLLLLDWDSLPDGYRWVDALFCLSLYLLTASGLVTLSLNWELKEGGTFVLYLSATIL